ncbi:MAG: type II secretion system F family protein [Nanoarchaeota archaeon]|nr:type II secretion system F family protein [Nanoarchaeota archaeon]
MEFSSEEFVKRTIHTAFMMSFMVMLIVFGFASAYVEKKVIWLVVLIGFPISVVCMFFYFLQMPTIKIMKLRKSVNKEIVFAGRFLIVELESGVSVFSALKNISKNFEVVGAYFQEIVEKVSVGTTLEGAINEAVDQVPSEALRRILWQIANSIQTGSNIVSPLANVVETLVREQQIEVAEYGRKLNPLAMFYMLIAVILPTLGITLLTIMTLFMGINLTLLHLMVILGLLGFMQFMFLAIINSSRPAIEL